MKTTQDLIDYIEVSNKRQEQKMHTYFASVEATLLKSAYFFSIWEVVLPFCTFKLIIN